MFSLQPASPPRSFSFAPNSEQFARIQRALEYLCRFEAHLKPGRYDLDGERVYALVQQYTTKPVEQSQFEAHRRYIDVQYVHAGRETILWAPIATLGTVTMPYDEKS